MPSNACFCNINSTGIPRLRRVLRAIAWLYPDIGYCQGTGMVSWTRSYLTYVNCRKSILCRSQNYYFNYYLLNISSVSYVISMFTVPVWKSVHSCLPYLIELVIISMFTVPVWKSLHSCLPYLIEFVIISMFTVPVWKSLHSFLPYLIELIVMFLFTEITVPG